MKQRLFATVLLTVLFFTACDLNYHQTIPYKKVDFVIYPNDPQYYRLNTKAVDDLVNADVSNSPEVSREELNKYRSGPKPVLCSCRFP